jgi:hypothetical protein
MARTNTIGVAAEPLLDFENAGFCFDMTPASENLA